MNLFLSLIARFLPGLDLDALEKMAIGQANAFVYAKLETFWNEQAPAIASQLQADGWTFDSTTPGRPTPPTAYAADILYRLWKALLHHGGLVIDTIRDIEAPKVTALAAPQFDPHDHEHNVRAVIKAQIEQLR